MTNNPKGFNAAALALIDARDGDRRTGKCRCPVCNKMALQVSNGDKVPVVVHCFAGDSREHDHEVIAQLRALDLWPTNDKLSPRTQGQVEKQSDDSRRQYATGIWNGLKGSGRRMAPLLLDYLGNRAIKNVPYGARITLPIGYDDSKIGSYDPGMVLPVRNKKGVLQGIHVVWLDGNLTGKREAEPQRQSYGQIKGNFIPLFKFDPNHAPETLLIAEGTETAMAASQLTGIPAIAAGGKSFFKDLEPPHCANYIILVDQDEDEGSRNAAGILAQHLVGCTVQIAAPEKPAGGKNGYDWNDALIDAGEDESKHAELAKLILEAPQFDAVMTKEEKREIRLNALARLMLDDHLAYEEQRGPAHTELGLRLSFLDDEVTRRCKLLKTAQEKAPSPVNIEELAASAREIIACDNVLRMFSDDIRQTIAGEAVNAKILFLAATSRLFNKAMHIAVKGPSAGGKSEIRKAVLEYFPPESVVTFTTVSEKALLYYDGDFEHKILSMGEAHGREELDLQNYLLRELMSENKLVYQVAQKVGGRIVTVVIVKNGPVCFIVTTTKNILNPENETRMLSLEIDDSEQQTARVMRKVAATEGLNVQSGVDLKAWHDYQRWLAAGEARVKVPFAMTLARLIKNTKSVRLRRDIGQVMRAIKAHALLHREHRKRDSEGTILATTYDYAVIRRLMADLLATGVELKMRQQMADTIAAVAKIVPGPWDGHDDTKAAGAREVGDILKIDMNTAWRRLKAAEASGFVVNLETRPGRPGRYRISGEELSEVCELLPTREELEQARQEARDRAR